MTFEEKIYHVAVSRGHADAKALAYFLFREVIEEVHAKYNISQEDIKAMNKRACNRAALYLSLSEKEKEALVIFTESTRPGAFSIGTRYIHSPSYFTDGNVPSIT